MFEIMRKFQSDYWKHCCTACCLQGLSMVGVQQIDRVVEVVEETLKGRFRNAKMFLVFKQVVLMNDLTSLALVRLKQEGSQI